MSCCGMPRKSDEPEYTMPQPLARLASSWEQGCPGIMRALHEEIATGDWDRQQAGFVPAYAPDKACHVALAVLEQTLRGNFTRHQHLHGPWYVRWGLSKASTDLPPVSMALLEAAREQIDDLARDIKASPAPPSAWTNPQVSVTWHGMESGFSRT